jgi:hypothetical protein
MRVYHDRLQRRAKMGHDGGNVRSSGMSNTANRPANAAQFLLSMMPIESRCLMLAVSISVLALAGCPTTKPVVYQNEWFESESPFSHSYEASTAQTCEAGRRALLSQGYIVSLAKSDMIDGKKNFQAQPDVHVEIEFHIVCAADGASKNHTTAFASAVQDRYALKKNSTSASVGVGVIGAVSVPFGSSDDSLVRVASETIISDQFYDHFFGLLAHYLEEDHGAVLQTPIEPPAAGHPQPNATGAVTPGVDTSTPAKTTGVQSGEGKPSDTAPAPSHSD